MGSFNRICAISGLPIAGGEKVRLLALTASKYGKPNELRHGVHGYWQLRTVPLRAKYDGYGGVEDVEEGLATRVFCGSFDEDVVECDVSRAPRIKKGMAQGLWLSALKEGQISVVCEISSGLILVAKYDRPGQPGPPRLVSQAMVREDVWRLLLKAPVALDWEEPAALFPRYMHDVRSFSRKLIKVVGEVARAPSDNAKGVLRAEFLSSIDQELDLGGNVAARLLLYGCEGVNGFSLRDALRVAIALSEDAKEPQGPAPRTLSAPLRAFVRDLAETLYVQSVYAQLLGHWHPTITASEAVSWTRQADYHRDLAKLADRHAKRGT